MMKEVDNSEFFRVFGQISVFFATLDMLVTTLTLQLVSGKRTDVARAATGTSTLGQKLRALRALTPDETNEPSAFATLGAFIDEAIRIADERNRYIHDLWMFGSETHSEEAITRLTVKGYDDTKRLPIVETQKKISLSEMHAFLAEIGEMQKKIGGLCSPFPPAEASRNAKQVMAAERGKT